MNKLTADRNNFTRKIDRLRANFKSVSTVSNGNQIELMKGLRTEKKLKNNKLKELEQRLKIVEKELPSKSRKRKANNNTTSNNTSNTSNTTRNINL